MILRNYRALVHEGQQDAFTKFLKEIALPTLDKHDGMISLTMGWPYDVNPRMFSMIMIWRDLDALIGFTGPDWQNTVVHPSEAHLLEASFVDHFKTDAQDGA